MICFHNDSLHKKDNRIILFTGFVLFALTMIIASIGVSNSHGWGGDFSQYIAQARALVEGNVSEWYERHSYTINHSSSGLGANAYPWMTSILIAPIYAFFGINFVPYLLFMSFCYALSVTFLYLLLLRRNVNFYVVLLICGALIFNSIILSYTKSILSDIPCFMFTIIAWFLIDKYIEMRSVKNAIIVGGVTFIAFATRTMALALLVSMGIVDLFYFVSEIKARRLTKKSLAIMCIPYGVFSVFFAVSSLILPKSGTTYLDYFSFDSNSILSNIYYYHEMILTLYTQGIQGYPNFPDFIKNNIDLFSLCILMVLVPFVIVLFQGAISRFKAADHLLIYSLVTLVMLYLYVYREKTRFIIYLFPVFILFAYYGIVGIKNNSQTISIFQKKLLKPLIIDYAIVLVFCILFGVLRISIGTTSSPPLDQSANAEDALSAYAYINDNLQDDDVVIFFKPRVLCLYTDVYSYTNSTDIPETIGDADYLLYFVEDHRYDEYIQNHHNSLIIQYSNERFTLFKIDKQNIGDNYDE